jgi:hypothetical protein
MLRVRDIDQITCMNHQEKHLSEFGIFGQFPGILGLTKTMLNFGHLFISMDLINKQLILVTICSVLLN